MMRYSHRRVFVIQQWKWMNTVTMWMNESQKCDVQWKKRASKKDNCWLEVHSFKFIKFKNMQNQATHWLGI